MAFERRFAAGFVWRMLLLLGALTLLTLALGRPDLAAGRIVCGILVLAAAWLLWRHVGRTNREVARFIEALRYDDFAQSFTRGGDTGFARLGAALNDAIRRLRDDRASALDESRVQAALADESPAALLLIDGEGRVTLANKAARKIFAHLRGTRIADFSSYGTELVAMMAGEETGGRRILSLRIDGMVQRTMVSRAALDAGGRRIGIVAIQPIQAELTAVELAAQADLVRVLTHEIMNSMTPIVSLAQSAAQLMAGVAAGGNRDIEDARLAIDTLARRSSGIMQFVDSYRAFSRPPDLARRRFAALPWAEELGRLFGASAAGKDAALTLRVEPADLAIEADPDLLCQVVMNLLKNGAEAAAGRDVAPALVLTIGLLPGGRVRLTIDDNGPGIPPDRAAEIFLPFYTTKRDGTGVGLSLAQRILAAHGGSIALGETTEGARFELTL